jgi:hypothetical protein
MREGYSGGGPPLPSWYKGPADIRLMCNRTANAWGASVKPASRPCRHRPP